MEKEATTEAVPDPARQGARRTPDAPALLEPSGAPVSYAALDRAVAETARRLREAGVHAGERVACLLPRTPAYATLLLALARCAAVAAPLPARTPAAGLAPLLRSIEADVLITGAGCAPVRYEAKTLDPAALVAGFEEAKDAPASALKPLRWPVERPFTLIFTSGSTGASKAALLTAGNHFFSADGARENLALDAGDRWLLSLPLYHVGGLSIVFRCLWAGATVAFPGTDETLGAALRRTRATHVSMVAAQLRRLLEEGEEWPALEAILLGGGPLPPVLLRAAHRRGWPLATSYGMTEMTSQAATTAPGAPLDALLQTAGRPLPHRRLRIAPDGEILVGGRTRFAGYVEDGTLRRPFDADGWFATGDLGRLDEDGRLRVRGRRDRRFVSGGENVQPEEIEAALRRLPDVADAAVVPVPDEAFGRRPVAFVRPSEGTAVPAGLAEALRAVLPAFKVPDAFFPWPEAGAGGMKPDRLFLQKRARKLVAGKSGRLRG